MAVSRAVVNILLLVLYLTVFIPFMLPPLMNMLIDFVNSSASMLQIQIPVYRVILYNNTYYLTQTESQYIDLRPVLVFLFQLIAYFGIPLILIFSVARRR